MESEHPEEGVYTLPITITVKHMFSTYIVVKGLDQQKFSFFTTERSKRVQKTYFSLKNIFVRLLLFCATPLNLPSWSLFFLVVVEVARPPTLVSWGSSAVLLDNLCLCVWLMIMTLTGYYIPFLAISILGSDWQRGRN